MTRFSAPFKIKQAFSETTVAAIKASGTAAVTMVSAGGDEDNVFVGPIASGSAAARGYAVLAQQATLVSNAAKVQVAQLPEGADFLNATLYVKSAFATAGADVVVRLGTSANETLFGTISIDTNIAKGMHQLTGTAFTSAGTNWTNLNGAGAVIHAAVTAVSGAVASGAEGVLTITYIHKV